MELVEIRDLDGPNLFAPYPVVKVEIRKNSGEIVPTAAIEDAKRVLGTNIPRDPIEALIVVIRVAHQVAGLAVPRTGVRRLDRSGHVAVYFDWQHRSAARMIANTAVDAVTLGLKRDPSAMFAKSVEADDAEDDRPLWVRDVERAIPAVGITGTNGKTTTTRLVAHILRRSGARVGWSSSTGVYIEGEQVIEGDYTGPAGAQRVLRDPTVDVGILETARGGILLRGLGYESNDVGVLLNVSADHLGLHGIERLETLAEVKSVVVRVTRSDGLVVLNADDPLVLAQRGGVRAPVLLTSQRPDAPAVLEHVKSDGSAIVREGDRVIFIRDAEHHELFRLHDAPLTFGGNARHMVENVLAASGAAIGLGVDLSVVTEGVRTFRPNAMMNPGRMNVFRLGEATVVVDYAHNESGLDSLLQFASTLVREGRLSAVVGTAGDRQDSVLRGIGRIAASRADIVYIKDNPRYLRGRQPGEVPRLIREGVLQAGAERRLRGPFAGELSACATAFDEARAGDVVAVMCVEEQQEIFQELKDRGAQEWP